MFIYILLTLPLRYDVNDYRFIIYNYMWAEIYKLSPTKTINIAAKQN